MAEDIENYVRENLKKGYSPESIKERLRTSGFDPSIVDRILVKTKTQEPKIPTISPNTPKQSLKPKIKSSTIIIILIIIGIIFITLLYIAPMLSYMWMRSMQEQTQGAIEQQLLEQQKSMVSRIDLQFVYKDTPTGNLAFVLENSGRSTYTVDDLNNFRFFVDGNPIDVSYTQKELVPRDNLEVTTSIPWKQDAGDTTLILVTPPFGSDIMYTCVSKEGQDYC